MEGDRNEMADMEEEFEKVFNESVEEVMVRARAGKAWARASGHRRRLRKPTQL